jgi:general secretion pathway protein G
MRHLRWVWTGNRECADTELQREAGFTLLELLVVIVIIGLLVGLVAPAALRQLGGARVSITKQSIERLGSILDMYKLDVGSYPSTSDGLEALVVKPADADNWNGPYVKAENGLLDPWRHPYVYRSPSDRSGHDYDICSLGPNGQQGDSDTSGMICNP